MAAQVDLRVQGIDEEWLLWRGVAVATMSITICDRY